MYSFIQKTVTEYLILARTEPGAEYTEVIPALTKLIVYRGCHGGFKKKGKTDENHSINL